MLKSVCFYHYCKSEPAFCTCSQAVCKGSHSLPSGICTRSQPWGWVHVWVTCLECWGAHGPVGESTLRCPQWLLVGLPDEVYEAVRRSHVPLICSPWDLGCCYPSCSPPPAHTVHSSVSGCSKRKWASLARSCTDGKLGAHTHTHSSYLWQKAWAEKASPDTEPWGPGGRGDPGKVKLVLPSLLCPILDLFFLQ